MRLKLKGCEVNVEALKSEETGTIVEKNFEIMFKMDAPEDRARRLHDFTSRTVPLVLFSRKQE